MRREEGLDLFRFVRRQVVENDGHFAAARLRAVRSREGPMYIRETIAIVDRLPITDEAREHIYWKNAAALLKL
jgi:predicted TIM-barrel fold metal-dependent hydrolase